MNHRIEQINEPEIKQKIAIEVIATLPEWFGNAEANNKYVEELKQYAFFSVFRETNEVIGFASLKIHHSKTADIFIVGIKPEFQRQRIGKELFLVCEKYCKLNKCTRIVVKTLSELSQYEPYLRTVRFYKKLGFEELITFDEFWDINNKCLLLIKDIKNHNF